MENYFLVNVLEKIALLGNWPKGHNISYLLNNDIIDTNDIIKHFLFIITMIFFLS